MLGELRATAAKAALADRADLPMHRASHVGLLERAWSLRSTVSFHDALYVALAERLDMTLITLDARLEGAAGVQATIEVIGRGAAR